MITAVFGRFWRPRLSFRFLLAFTLWSIPLAETGLIFYLVVPIFVPSYDKAERDTVSTWNAVVLVDMKI